MEHSCATDRFVTEGRHPPSVKDLAMTQVIHLTNRDDPYEWWDENVGEEAGLIFCG